MIDLRSDTVTRPSQGMREAMASAPVGDDVFQEDPTVNALQEDMAARFGMESALYVTSGVMANQLAIKAHTEPGDEVIVEGESHVFHYETGSPAIISGVQLHCVPGERGLLSPDVIARAIRGPEYYFPRTSLAIVENTHNRAGGTVYQVERIAAIREVCNRGGLKLHIDGARLWNAHVATGTPLNAYGALADSISVCFSKGLGAPVGSMLLGRREAIRKAHKFRKILGGGMRQSGILAAAAQYALNHNVRRLREDHANAAAFANALADMAPGFIDLDSVQTNIVLVNCAAIQTLVEPLLVRLAEQGVRLSPGREGMARAVFHLDVSAEETQTAIEAFRKVI